MAEETIHNIKIFFSASPKGHYKNWWKIQKFYVNLYIVASKEKVLKMTLKVYCSKIRKQQKLIVLKKKA